MSMTNVLKYSINNSYIGMFHCLMALKMYWLRFAMINYILETHYSIWFSEAKIAITWVYNIHIRFITTNNQAHISMIITISLNQNHQFGIPQLISMSNHYNIGFNLKLLVFIKKISFKMQTNHNIYHE